MGYRARLSDEEYKLIKEFRGIQIASNENDLNLEDVIHGWIKSKTASLFFTNPAHEIPDFDISKVDFSELVKAFPIITHNPIHTVNNGIFDRLVYTDVHTGMNPNPDGYSLYGGVYNEDEVIRRLNNMKERKLLIHTIAENYLIEYC